MIVIRVTDRQGLCENACENGNAAPDGGPLNHARPRPTLASMGAPQDGTDNTRLNDVFGPLRPRSWGIFFKKYDPYTLVTDPSPRGTGFTLAKAPTSVAWMLTVSERAGNVNGIAYYFSKEEALEDWAILTWGDIEGEEWSATPPRWTRPKGTAPRGML